MIKKLIYRTCGLFLATGITLLMMTEPTRSDILKVAIEDTSIRELGIVKNRTDLMRLSGKRVKVVGYYTSQARNPGSTANTIEFQGMYIRSQIVLEDGTVISIFPSWLKQSLRSAEEATKYTGKIVEVSGKVEFEATSRIDTKTRESFIELQSLKPIDK
jgi:hypothetical protein